MIDQRDMADAPRDGTKILVSVQPAPFKRTEKGKVRIITPEPRHLLVRWFGQPSDGHWSTHPKGTGKVQGRLLGWWPLPERSAA